MAAKKSSGGSGKGSSMGLAIGLVGGLAVVGGAIWGLARLERSATPPGAPSASAAPSSSAPAPAASGSVSASATVAPASAPSSAPQDAAPELGSPEAGSVDGATASATDGGGEPADSGLREARDGGPAAAGKARAELEVTAPTAGLARGERPGKATREAIAFAEEVCAAAAPEVAACDDGGATDAGAATVDVRVHALVKDGYVGREALGDAKGRPKLAACAAAATLRALDGHLDPDRGGLDDLEGRAFFRCTYGR